MVYIFFKNIKRYMASSKGKLTNTVYPEGFFSRVTKFEKKWANLFALVFFFFFLFLLSETQVYVCKQCRSEQSYVFLHC